MRIQTTLGLAVFENGALLDESCAGSPNLHPDNASTNSKKTYASDFSWGIGSRGTSNGRLRMDRRKPFPTILNINDTTAHKHIFAMGTHRYSCK